jgi:phosphatidylglycerol---prolipoprotein diacylglyceryl transferase
VIVTVLATVLATLPAPPGSQFEIGPLNLRAYGLMIGLGVVAGVYLLGHEFEAKRVGTRDDASSISMWGVAAGIVGARLYHVATDWERFDDDLGAIPKIWKGGLGIPGGLVAGIVVGLYVAHRRGLDMARVATCAAPAIPLSQSIGRLGNWFNQELFGRPTDLPWALEVDADKVPPGYPAGTTFHPTFLYESLWNVGLVGVLLLVDRRLRLGPGRLLAVYILGYGLGRLWVEGLRIDPAHELGGLRWNQWVALAAIVGGAAYLVLTRGRRWIEPAPADVTPDLQDQPG